MKCSIRIILSVLLGLIVALILPVTIESSLEISTARDLPNFTISSDDHATSNNSISLLNKGIEAYEAENLAEALNYWQTAYQIFVERNDSLSQALTHSYLSLAYQKLGRWQEAEKSLQQGKELVKNFDLNPIYLEVEAKIFNSQASFYWHKGELEAALKSWDAVINNYQQLNDLYGILTATINHAQTLQSLGFTIKAREELEQIYRDLEGRSTTIETELKQQVTGFCLLGSVYRRLGMLQESSISLQQGLVIASKLSSDSIEGKIMLELGNTERSLGHKYLTIGNTKIENLHNTAAINWYRQASKKLGKIEPEINLLSLLIEIGQWQELETIIQNIETKIATIPDSRQSLAAGLNFMRSLTCLQQINKLRDTSCVNVEFREDIRAKINQGYLPTISSRSWRQIGSFLATIQQKSLRLKDRYIEAYTTTQLGHLYEIEGQWQTAQKLTEQALVIAEELQSQELRYRGEWQLGRLREKQQDIEGAIAAYSSSVKSLKSVRQNLTLVSNNTQFSFQDNAEPIYNKLVDLLLKNGNLERTIDVINSFKLAELENFLGCKLNLLVRLDNNLKKVDPQAVLIYPIILENRLEVLYQFPQQPIKHFSTAIDRTMVQKTIKELRIALVRRDVSSLKRRSELLYQWIFAPLEAELRKSPQSKNLVFIADSYLQTIPLTVLYDRNSQEYLLQKEYNIVSLPSANIFQIERNSEKFNVLGGGISKKIQVKDKNFSAINTIKELSKISNNINTKILIDSAFTENNLSKNIHDNNYSIVHLATHGSFSSDPEETFLIVHSSQGDRGELLKAKELDKIIRANNINDDKKLELLVLSACQTALGDNRATLGLAGMTVAAGANSSIGTLWQVSDESVINFMEHFYQELAKPDVSKAEAVRIAQQALFADARYKNPYYWSPFIFVGNWL